MAWIQLVRRSGCLSKRQVLSPDHIGANISRVEANVFAHSRGGAKHWQGRAYSGYINNLAKRLKQTGDSADAEVALLKEYNKTDPDYVILWYERSQPHQWYKGAFLAEYLKALVKVDKLDEHELLATLKEGVKARVGTMVHGSVFPAKRGTSPFVGSAANENVLGSASSPIHMVNSSGNFKFQLWRFFRAASLALILLSALGTYVDDKAISKSLGLSEELVRPSFEKSTKFDDVKGVDEAKQELQEIVEYLKDPKKFTALGGKLPKGVLLTGPPGSGKTMLARAVAGEAGVPFFYSSGSEFEEMFVGIGARRVRDLFAAAKKHSPCIVFMDEIDAIGGMRNERDLQYARMTLNQLLVELDGFKQNEGVIVIAATNFPESLDQALVRPGRFDHHVEIVLPDVEGRRQILESHMSKVLKAEDVDLRIVARGTPGFSGAELANLVNVAALKAAMDGSKAVSMSELDYAKDKILMGSERKSAVLSKETRRLIAYHEAAHALVAIMTDGALPVHKATILPRGHSMGLTVYLPEGDEDSVSRKQMLALIRVALASRAAEELVFGDSEITIGAQKDLREATNRAQRMVTQFGMSKKVGPVSHDYEAQGSMSTETRRMVETEVQELLQEAYNDARQVLITNQDALHALADALLEQETMTGTQIKELVAKVGASKKEELAPTTQVTLAPAQQCNNPLPAAAATAAAAATTAAAAAAASTNVAPHPAGS